MKHTLILVLALAMSGIAYWWLSAAGGTGSGAVATSASQTAVESANATGATADQLARATFAGGCFWCMEPPYDKLEGVVSTVSGYAGGHLKDPSYQAVTTGQTGHAEVVQVTYDPAVVSYQQLLEVFWRNIDPTTPNRQFCDAGSQYRTAIYTHDAEQARLASESRLQLDASGQLPAPVVTEIEPLEVFYPAEDYHQNYYQKNPLRYKFYRTSCGRDARLDELWKPSED